MKKYIYLFALPLVLGLSTCRKIEYPEGDKVPLRKFKKYIDGTWSIKSFQSVVARFSPYPSELNADSITYYNNIFGGSGNIIIDYPNTLDLVWGRNKMFNKFDNYGNSTNIREYKTYNIKLEIFDSIALSLFGRIPLGHAEIIKLDKKEFKLYGSHSGLLVLNK